MLFSTTINSRAAAKAFCLLALQTSGSGLVKNVSCQDVGLSPEQKQVLNAWKKEQAMQLQVDKDPFAVLQINRNDYEQVDDEAKSDYIWGYEANQKTLDKNEGLAEQAGQLLRNSEAMQRWQKEKEADDQKQNEDQTQWSTYEIKAEHVLAFVIGLIVTGLSWQDLGCWAGFLGAFQQFIVYAVQWGLIHLPEQGTDSDQQYSRLHRTPQNVNQ